ncbi:hypothetical protein IJ596_06410 [bacterium]|nr:hypothetical protein [bacterium]
MDKETKNILIVGNGACAYALAKKLHQNGKYKIFVTSNQNFNFDFCELVDLRENDLTGLLKFALDKDVFMTIPISETALKSDIVSFFQTNEQNIFGPCKKSCNMMLNNSACKKFLYKIHAQCPKFGVFNKLQNAVDYLKQSTFPVVISSCETSKISGSDKLVIPTTSLASRFLEELFVNKSELEVLIEDYIYGKNFVIYFITDGYSALPIGITGDYKFLQDGDGGLLTNGSGCYAPNYNISKTVIDRLQNITDNILATLAQKDIPYVGIIGLEGVTTKDDRFLIKNLVPFLQNHDASAVLNLVEENLTELFNSCIHGFFSDEYQQIKTSNSSSVSAVVFSKKDNTEINGLENTEDINNIDFINAEYKDDKYLAKQGAAFTITRTSATLTRAKNFLYEDIQEIDFDGIQYRKDILQNKN